MTPPGSFSHRGFCRAFVLACLCLLGSAAAAVSPAAQAATPGAKAGTATAKAHALDGLAPLTWFEVPNSAVSTSGAMYQYPAGVFFGNSPHIRFFDESGASWQTSGWTRETRFSPDWPGAAWSASPTSRADLAADRARARR